jgi:hypothetical protein
MMGKKIIINNMIDIKKIHDAVLDMMSKVRFIDDKNQHHYEEIKTGLRLQGVSTVSSIIPKDWLSAWGAKEAVKALGYSDYEGDTALAKEIMEKIIALETPEEFIAMLKEAKGASGRKSKTALVDGKAGHSWLETYVKAKIRGTELPEVPTGTLERPINQFLEWEKENIKQWVLSEARVAYPEKGYAGTLDAMSITRADKLAVVDFKFASHISEDYYLQTAGYAATFEPYGIKIDERIIIRLPKTLTIEEYDQVEHKYKMIENNIEVLTVPTSYELDRDTFYHCLPVKSWINLMITHSKYNNK